MTDNAKSPILSKNVSSSIGLEPSLRFPGFEGEWLPTTIGEICDFQNGKAHEKDVDEFGKFIIVNSKFISSDGTIAKYSNKQICPLYKNDIVMVMSDVPKGKAIAKCLLIDTDNKYTLNQRICSLRAKEAPFFYLLQINRNDYFLKFDDGVKQTNLRKEDILSCPIYKTMPQEQQKIADFLSLVDERIEKQRQLVEVLKRYKRGLLFDIFNRKIRFPTYSAEWEETTLGSVCKITMGQSPNSTSYNMRNDGLPLVQGNADMKDRMTCPQRYTNKPVKIAEPGCIIMSVRAPVGTVGLSNQKVCLGRGVCSISGCNTDFIYQYMLSKEESWKHIEQGGTFTAVSFSDISTFPIAIPEIPEMKKIAEYLNCFDKLVYSQARFLIELEQIKKSLLQNMFV